MFIGPLKPFSREFATAPDKSITHRAVMLGSAANGKTVITNALLGGDCLSTVACMRALGAKIEISGRTVTVTGAERFRDAEIDAGNSGTTARLLMGLTAGLGCKVRICGDASLSSRPMRRVADPLGRMGASIEMTDGRLPATVYPAALSGINYISPTPSAQVKSAILLAGLSANGVTSVTESVKSRDHTEIMLRGMGADIAVDGLTVSVRRSSLRAADVFVPGDISSAAYLLGLAAVVKGARVTVKDVGLNPTRTGIIKVLTAMGADIEVLEKQGIEPYGDITLVNGSLRAFEIDKEIVPSLIDELPLLAAIACYADGTSVIRGAGELKVKESNRIDTTVAMLKAFGADITATDDGMIINGRGGLRGGGTADSAGDHRIAMSAAVAAAGSKLGGTILGEECANISYPEFFPMLGGLL